MAASRDLPSESAKPTAYFLLCVRQRTESLAGHGNNWSSETSPLLPDSILRKITVMLYTVAVVLLIMWLLGLVTSTTIGGFIHVLLVIAVVVLLLRVISGRRL